MITRLTLCVRVKQVNSMLSTYAHVRTCSQCAWKERWLAAKRLTAVTCCVRGAEGPGPVAKDAPRRQSSSNKAQHGLSVSTQGSSSQPEHCTTTAEAAAAVVWSLKVRGLISFTVPVACGGNCRTHMTKNGMTEMIPVIF